VTTVFLEEIQTASGPQEVALSLSQKFPWFGKRALRSQIAYHDAMATYSRVTSTELKVIEQVKRAYFDLYFIQAAVKENRRQTPGGHRRSRPSDARSSLWARLPRRST